MDGNSMDNNHTATNSSEEEDELIIVKYHPAWIAFQCLFFVTAGFFGVVGNCIALVALATTPKLRNTCTALIGNLCVSDLVSSLQLLFLLTPSVLNEGYPEDMVMCKFMLYLPTCAYSASLTTLIFIAFNRYLLITRPRTCYRTCCGSKQVVVYIILIWIITLAVVILPAVQGTSKVVFDPEGPGCVVESNWLFQTIVLCFYVVVPVFVIVPLLYGLMVCAAKASHRRVHARSVTAAATDPLPAPPVQGQEPSVISTVSNSVNNNNQEECGQHPRAISKREINLTRVPILIFTVFAVCWTPVLIDHICSGFFKVPAYYKKIASLFILSNAAINPYLYAWSNRNFRQAYKRILGRLKSSCKKRP